VPTKPTKEPWSDPIVAEVRKARDQYAASFGYDLDRIFADIERLQEERKARGGVIVSFPPKRVPVPAGK
jgi:hypothetical protein